MVRRRALAGFTLKELAIVTAVISALAVISYSFFQEWLIKVHGPTCQGNMRQLGLALVQYTQDADQILPSGKTANGNGWAGQLYQYVKSTSIYRCPCDEHQGSFISYAENQNSVRKHLYDFADPAGTVALYEFTTLNCDPSHSETVSATGLSAPQDSTRHDEKTFALNFVLADGHVKYLTPKQVSNGAGAVPPTHKAGYLATFAVK